MKQAFLPILVLVVIVGLAVITTWPVSSVEADHYQRFHDGKSLYAVLSSRIRNGDSLQEVEEVLGLSKEIESGELNELRDRLRDQSLASPERFPDGVDDNDVFVGYPIGDNEVRLQFRNGTLVNHIPGAFVEYIPARDVAGYTGSVGGKAPVIESSPAH